MCSFPDFDISSKSDWLTYESCRPTGNEPMNLSKQPNRKARRSRMKWSVFRPSPRHRDKQPQLVAQQVPFRAEHLSKHEQLSCDSVGEGTSAHKTHYAPTRATALHRQKMHSKSTLTSSLPSVSLRSPSAARPDSPASFWHRQTCVPDWRFRCRTKRAAPVRVGRRAAVSVPIMRQGKMEIWPCCWRCR